MKHQRFEKRLREIMPEIVTKISQIDQLQGQWISGARLSPQVLGRLKKSVLVTSTGASTRIEGAILSDEEIAKMMRGISIQNMRERDGQEVKGYYELLENVFASWKGLVFNEALIKHFHKELLKHSDKDKRHRGDYKKQENKVHMVDEAGHSLGILFNTTDAWLTPKEMQELVEWTLTALSEKVFHPLLVVANFIVEFLAIHPFQDGNGRLSRVLTNLLLLQQGYAYMPYVSHEKLVEDNKPDYYLALRTTQKSFGTAKETIAPWLTFFLDTFLKQSQMAVDLLSRESIEKILTRKQLAVWNYIQSVEDCTPLEIFHATEVGLPTVRQTLQKLLQLKKIDRIGQGRGTRYRKAPPEAGL